MHPRCATGLGPGGEPRQRLAAVAFPSPGEAAGRIAHGDLHIHLVPHPDAATQTFSTGARNWPSKTTCRVSPGASTRPNGVSHGSSKESQTAMVVLIALSKWFSLPIIPLTKVDFAGK